MFIRAALIGCTRKHFDTHVTRYWGTLHDRRQVLTKTCRFIEQDSSKLNPML